MSPEWQKGVSYVMLPTSKPPDQPGRDWCSVTSPTKSVPGEEESGWDAGCLALKAAILTIAMISSEEVWQTTLLK